MKTRINTLGAILLGVWLLTYGFVQLVPALAGLAFLLAILAIITGIVILAGQ